MVALLAEAEEAAVAVEDKKIKCKFLAGCLGKGFEILHFIVLYIKENMI